MAALYTHNIAAINLAALHLATIPLLAGHRDKRRALLLLILADLAVAVGYLPWLSYLPGQLEKVNRAFWIPIPGVAELVRTPVFFLFNLPVPNWALPVLLFWTVLIAVAVWRATLPLLKASPVVRPSNDSLYVVLLAVTPVALMFAVSQVRPIYVERGVLVAAVAGYLLLGWAIAQLRRPIERAVLLGGTVALMLGALVYYYGYAKFPSSC